MSKIIGNTTATTQSLDGYATEDFVNDKIVQTTGESEALVMSQKATTEAINEAKASIVDSTLTQSGQAADAKVVGDALSSLSEEIVTTSESKVSAHNTGTDTHSDIRGLIQGLTDRLNALADSDDTTLDQLSEVVAYIKSNRTLIEAITTSKVSVADIVDNLTTNVANKPLSAAQGVALKALIDAISVPDKLPNPNALTFTGAVTGTYDGSAAVSVEIPSGGGGIPETPVSVVAPTAVNLTASRIFYHVSSDMETISVTYDELPNGWVGFLTIYNIMGASFSSDVMEATSINGVTQTALGNMSGTCIPIVLFKYGGSTILQWFVFKS